MNKDLIKTIADQLLIAYYKMENNMPISENEIKILLLNAGNELRNELKNQAS